MAGELFVSRLLTAVPELRQTYTEHISDNATLLPHVFMGNIAAFVVAQTDNPEKRELLIRLLTFLENEFCDPSRETNDLIVASFLENLTGQHAALRQLKPMMGLN